MEIRRRPITQSKRLILRPIYVMPSEPPICIQTGGFSPAHPAFGTKPQDTLPDPLLDT
jgi:hypothetical protein